MLLIIIGAAIIFGDDPSKNELKKVNSEEPKVDERAETLKNLVVPSNFPKSAKFYFGSQSGTAEKLCQILEEEANQL